MAIKATIFKANLQIADMDRRIYVDHAVTIARHPSETDERMMVRLFALALNVPADNTQGTLELAKDLWDSDEPSLWRRDLTGQLMHWIDVGQPDERRLLKASGRAGRVSVFSYSASTPIWWAGIAHRIARARNVAVWQIEASASQALAALAQRSMQLQLSVQDGTAWIGDGTQTVEITPKRLEG
ncbi:MAG: YaeQ family protein [Burkholderiaceae bacterium]